MSVAANLASGERELTAHIQHPLLESDATFYLPLTRSRPDTGRPNTRRLAITLTSEERSRAEALALINRRYAWRGYGSNHWFTGGYAETTFTARVDDDLIGTVTLATDAGSGLAVDATFPEEMQFFRRKRNARLCELKKLAMEYGADARPVLASLFHFVFIYGTNNYLGTDLLIEVNPRHAAFYERMLRFRRVGAIRTNWSVNASSQLMWLPVSDIAAAISPIGHRDNNSLYSYFYNRKLEDRIVNQLNDRALRESSDECYP